MDWYCDLQNLNHRCVQTLENETTCSRLVTGGRDQHLPARCCSWTPQADAITVVVHNKQFGEGGLRNVRQLREIDPADGSYIEYVAKWFKFEVGEYLSTHQMPVFSICLTPPRPLADCDWACHRHRQTNETGTLLRPKHKWLQRTYHGSSIVYLLARQKKSALCRWL